MPAINLNLPHALPQPSAQARIKNLLSDLKSEHGDDIKDLTENWSGNTGEFRFKVKGFEVSGKLIVGERDVRLEGKIPLVAYPFKSKIEETILKRGKQLLA